MKRKIKLTDNVTGKVITGEINLRGEDHFEAQRKFKSVIFKPRKGKGSFKRNKKIKDFDE